MLNLIQNMKNFINLTVLLTLTVLVSCTSSKTYTKNKNYSFPNDWIGNYKGTMQWYIGSVKKADIPISIEILAGSDFNSIIWRTTYDSTKLFPIKTVKDYKIVWNDSLENGHYLMDEHNGIYLDIRLIDKAFYSCYDVVNEAKAKTTRLVSIDKLVNKNVICHEIISYPEPDKKTGNEDASDGFTVKSTEKISTQKAYLTKIK